MQVLGLCDNGTMQNVARASRQLREDVPSALPTKIIRLLMEMRRLDKMYLDIINFDPSQNGKFQSQLSKNMFSTSLRTLWIQADDQIVAGVLGVLQKNTLEAFGTSGLQT
ncbi:hypothetical protein Brms1b_007842 [Colletotrichum noveboracense]|nr:hypothetical protein CBS470a_006819 [Colletotrichum nupharicola]KAJ0312634.1 hypothetical protein Brms1b_007842 [Colletotrichum noveboracense]